MKRSSSERTHAIVDKAAAALRDLFPGTRIGQKDSESEIELTARGFRFATSVGGTLAGRGGDMIIIDDPLIAAEATSRVCRGVELDALYVDVIIRRYEAASGEAAVHVESGETFQALARRRALERALA